ncbi:hypothetical protein F4818DRAFT_444642 [Hypoxylon cercidicola]|nr:hypothetical protein F4818DRAFT_444642 [Hypoxylon cercidicola]
MLISLGFITEEEYEESPLMQCAYYNFGCNPNADYTAKGLLVSKLFPDEKDHSKLREKLEIEKLFDHPEVKATWRSSGQDTKWRNKATLQSIRTRETYTGTARATSESSSASNLGAYPQLATEIP